MSFDFKDLLQEEVKTLVAYEKATRLYLLLGCDENTYTQNGGAPIATCGKENLHGFLMDKGLIILNKGNELTFLDRRQEVISIMVCTERVVSLIRD